MSTPRHRARGLDRTLGSLAGNVWAAIVSRLVRAATDPHNAAAFGMHWGLYSGQQLHVDQGPEGRA